MLPKIVICNFIEDIAELKDFAHEHGFSGIDWSFELETLPKTPTDETKWVNNLFSLNPLEIRYHCPFYKTDLGHTDPEKAKAAAEIFKRIIRLVSRADGKFLSIHIGLGRNSTKPLRWEETIANLRRIVQFGAEHGVKVCLENLAWGWTSKPNLFEKLIRRSGAGVTFDIGHADACESVKSQQYAVEDFVSPHPGRVINAHIYHTEISGVGHMPPDTLEDLEARLQLLQNIGCKWWVIEIREKEGLLKTKKIIDEYLFQSVTTPKEDVL